MQPRTKIAFEAMGDKPEIRAAIEKHINKLEQQLGPLRLCSVTVKAPGPQRTGRFEVTIRLAVAEATEITVGLPPQIDPRYTDLTFALSDTFRRATRRLRDQARALPSRAKKAPGQTRVGKSPANALRASDSASASAPVEPAAASAPVEPVAATAPLEGAAASAPLEGAAETAPLEPAAVAQQPPSLPRSEAAIGSGDCNGFEPSPDEVSQGPAASTGPELALSIKAVAGAASSTSTAPSPGAEPSACAVQPPGPTAECSEPRLVEVVRGKAKRGEPVMRHAVQDGTAPRPQLEPAAPAEITTAADKQPAIATSATADPSASKAEPKTAPRDPLAGMPLPKAEKCEKANPRRPVLPVRLPTMTPLGFLAAMGGFMRTAAAFNLASTNFMNSYLACSAGLFNPMRADKPSEAGAAAKSLDAAKS